MSFELSQRESIKTFLSVLRSFLWNSDKATLLFYQTDLYFLQNFDKINDISSEKTVLISIFQPKFFSNLFYPTNQFIAIEFEIREIYRQLSLLRKKLSSFTFEIPEFLNNNSSKSIEENSQISLNLKYNSTEFSFILNQKLKVFLIKPPNAPFLLKELSNLKNPLFWKRILEFKVENLVNFTDFKDFYLDIVMNPEYLACKQADIPVNYSINIKKNKLEDYSNDVCQKDFEGRNKLQMKTGKLLNFFQLCREMKKNPLVFLSKKRGNGDIHRILLMAEEREKIEVFFIFTGLLEMANEGDLMRNPFELLEEESLRSENQEENKEDPEDFSDIEFEELEKAVNDIKNKGISEKNQEKPEINKEKVVFSEINSEKTSFSKKDTSFSKGFLKNNSSNIQMKNSAMGFFGGILNDENSKDSLINKITKRKDEGFIGFPDRESKRIKPVEKAINSMNITKKPEISQFEKKLISNSEILSQKTPVFVKDPNYVLKHRDFFK